jgi:hypothetical protein
MARSIIQGRVSKNKVNNSLDSGLEIGALAFPGPDEILKDVVLDQMMMDG